VPVALDCLEAPEPFTLRERKTDNERRALTPLVVKCAVSPIARQAAKPDEKPVQNITLLLLGTARIPSLGALRRRYCGALRVIAITFKGLENETSPG
jgi:hypothetical protein